MTRPPLKIKCNTTDCPNDLHWFRKKPRTKDEKAYGPCNECGADRIDWQQPHQRNIADAQTTFAQLRREWIRHYCWHEWLDQRAINYALRKGRTELRGAVRRRLEQSIGPATPWRDGAQTTFGGTNPTNYARHATASCCRKCVAEWHGIPEGKALTSDEIDYLTDLAMLYLEERIPELTDDPQTIAPIRTKHGN